MEGVLHPDGTLALAKEELPDHTVRVMVTLLEAADETPLGDYNEQLRDYEGRLARGDIRWQQGRST